MLASRPDLRGALHLEELLDADSVWSAVRTPQASALEFEVSGGFDDSASGRFAEALHVARSNASAPRD